MKKNVRVPISFSQERRGDGQMALLVPVTLSFVCHLLFLVIFVITPSLRVERPPARSVINVSMVSFKKTAQPTAKQPAVTKKTPTVKKSPQVKPAQKPPVKKKTPAKAIKAAPKPKTSLKKKTFKSTQVVKRAIQELEAKVAAQPDQKPEPLQSALDRLRKEVDQTQARSAKDAADSTQPSGASAVGKRAIGDEGGKKTAELIDLYRLEVAFQIQKNWAFNEQLAGGDGSLVAAIVFKVMPDGEIRDIFFTDRSGNAYLDDQAYKAIVKSNPVDGHPSGLVQPYVQMGVRFTPQGLR